MINQDALSTGCSGMSEMQGKVKKREAAHPGPMYGRLPLPLPLSLPRTLPCMREVFEGGGIGSWWWWWAVSHWPWLVDHPSPQQDMVRLLTR